MVDEGGGREQQNPFCGPRRPKRQFSAMSYIYLYLFLFFIFFPNIKFIYSVWYQSKSLQLGQSAQSGNGLDIYEWGWNWVKIQLCLNLE